MSVKIKQREEKEGIYDIFLTRGDSLPLTVEIENYKPDANDTITFAVKKQFMSKEPLLTKEIDIASMSTLIMPEETKHLDFGVYHYDIQLKYGAMIDTFIQGKLFIENEVAN